MAEKRKHADEELQGTRLADSDADQQQLVHVKRQRTEETQGGALVAVQPNAGQLIRAADANAPPPRTSSLQAATMHLTGHGAAVYAARFDHTGSHLASAGADKQILLWEIAGECKNSSVFTGHDGPVLDLAWSPLGDQLFSASVDKSACIWDVESGARVKRMRGHSGIVNSVALTRRGTQYAVTGGDDCAVNVWDPRARRPAQTLAESYQVLSVAWSDDATQVFSAGISNDIKCYDLRTERILYSLTGHRDSVTCVRLSPDGSYLLSNAMDQTLRCWDVRPFVAAAAEGGAPARLTAVYKGHTHDLEQNLLRCAWSADGLRVAAGSADRTVNVWEAATGRALFRLPGHKGAVNDVAFHPAEPIIASASSDKTLLVGEMS